MLTPSTASKSKKLKKHLKVRKQKTSYIIYGAATLLRKTTMYEYGKGSKADY